MDSPFNEQYVNIKYEILIIKITLANAIITDIRQKISGFDSGRRIFYPSSQIPYFLSF